MAEPRVTVIDSVFASLPIPADEHERRQRENVKKVVARYVPSIIKEARPVILEEGRQSVLKALGVQRVEEAGQIVDLKKQHAEQVQLVTATVGAKSLYKGLAIGAALALFTGVMGVLGGYWLFERGVTTQVAAQRVPRAAAPTLRYEPGDVPMRYDEPAGEP